MAGQGVALLGEDVGLDPRSAGPDELLPLRPGCAPEEDRGLAPAPRLRRPYLASCRRPALAAAAAACGAAAVLSASGQLQARSSAAAASLRGQVLLAAPAGASCASYGCGDYVTGRACQCNPGCRFLNLCCSDYEIQCPVPKSNVTIPFSCAMFGCTGALERKNADCQCTDSCVEEGSCCDDYEQVCTAQQNVLLGTAKKATKTASADQGAATTTRIGDSGGCSVDGEDCSSTLCCSEPGKQCYKKNDYFATCLNSCTAGDVDEEDSVPWSCELLGERTPSEGGGSLDEELGATTTAGDEAFDCAAGLSAWEKGWSEEKKEWCCLNKNSSTCPFDCVAGLPAWERGWSEEKKEWCCLNKNTSTCKFHFDCEAGFDRWEQGWSDEKKEWCCANRQTPTCQERSNSTKTSKLGELCGDTLGECEEGLICERPSSAPGSCVKAEAMPPQQEAPAALPQTVQLGAPPPAAPPAAAPTQPEGSSSTAAATSTTTVSSAAGNSSDAGPNEDLSPGHHCATNQFCGFPNHTSVSQILCPSTNRCPGEGAPSFPRCSPGASDACACEQEMDGGKQRKTCKCPQTGDCYDSVPPGQEPPAGADDQAVEAFAEDHAPGSDCAQGQYCGFPNGTSPSQILCPSSDRCPGEGSPAFPECTPGMPNACACEQQMNGDQQALTCECPQTGDCYDALPPDSAAGGSSATNVSSSDGNSSTAMASSTTTVSSAEGNSSDAGTDEDLSPGHHCATNQFCGFPNHTSVSQILCPSTNRCPGEGAPSFPQCTPGEADACACEQEMDGDQQRKTCACPQTGDCYDSVPPGQEPPAGEDDQAVEAFAEDHAPGSDCSQGQYCGFPDSTSSSQILCPSSGRCPGEGSPSFPTCTPGMQNACACQQVMDGEQQALTCECPQSGDCYDALPPGDSSTGAPSGDGDDAAGAGTDEDCKDVSGEYAGQGMDEIVKIEQSGCDLVVELGPFRNTGSVEGSTVQVQTFEGTGAVKENGDIEFSDGGYWQRQGPLAEA